MLAHVIYILSMTILALSVPHPTVSAVSGTLITVGLIGAWRYAWAGINLARAAYFLKYAYPRRRRLAAEAGDQHEAAPQQHAGQDVEVTATRDSSGHGRLSATTIRHPLCRSVPILKNELI